MGWKYIVFRVRDRELPIIFPDSMIHSVMAQAVKDYFVREAKDLDMPSRVDVVPVSAGSISLYDIACHGKSETLKLSSRKEDTSLIGGFEYGHGVVGE